MQATTEAELKILMVAGLTGEAAAHRALLDRLSGHLRAYFKGRLARIGRGATEAEDLVQEALLAIHIQRHTYDPAEPLTPWVYAIARYKPPPTARHAISGSGICASRRMSATMVRRRGRLPSCLRE